MNINYGNWFLEYMGLIFLYLLLVLLLCWIGWVTKELFKLENRLDRQDEINEHFKLKKEYREDYDE